MVCHEVDLHPCWTGPRITYWSIKIGRDLFYLDQTGSWTTIIWLVLLIYFNEVRSVRCYQLSLQSSSFQRYIISCEFVGNFSLESVDRQLLKVYRPYSYLHVGPTWAVAVHIPIYFDDSSFIECMQFVCI